MSLEQEIKLCVQQTDMLDLPMVSSIATLMQGKMQLNNLVSTYFDTLNLDLMQRGLGLRMRCCNGQWLQTVKTSGVVVNGLHQRDEWEHELASPNWNITKLMETALADSVSDSKVWDNVSELFTTDFIRHTIQLKLADGSDVELAYDRGEVRCGNSSEIIHEIELELKSGSVEQLKLLADQLCLQLPVSLSDISKAQQGYQLAQKCLNLASR
ncbi:MAG: CYTH domain-containing protein [Gammaproteobacteria bacterium]|nr:CYTH domain-containing protein [Gammaproteobacteria bacterium]